MAVVRDLHQDLDRPAVIGLLDPLAQRRLDQRQPGLDLERHVGREVRQLADPRRASQGEEGKDAVFEPLDGMAKMGKERPGAEVFAWAEGNGIKLPVLVATQVGAGRTMAFGGDTTWRAWRRQR